MSHQMAGWVLSSARTVDRPLMMRSEFRASESIGMMRPSYDTGMREKVLRSYLPVCLGGAPAENRYSTQQAVMIPGQSTPPRAGARGNAFEGVFEGFLLIAFVAPTDRLRKN